MAAVVVAAVVGVDVLQEHRAELEVAMEEEEDSVEVSCSNCDLAKQTVKKKTLFLKS